MSFWEQYFAVCRYMWTNYKWQMIVALGFSVVIDIVRAHYGMPYFSVLPWSIRP
jgi:hypothetical protein